MQNGWNFNYIIEQKKIQTGVDLNLEDCLHGLDKYIYIKKKQSVP